MSIADTPATGAVLDIKQVAEKTRYAVQTLYNLRNRGEGPKSFTLRGRVRYYEADVDAWIAQAAAAA